MFAEMNDIKSYIKVDGLLDVAVYTAGSATYDNALYTTGYTDRANFDSVVIGCNYTVGLASGESITCPGTIQHSDSTTLASFSDFVAVHLGTLTASGAALASPTIGALSNGINLEGAKRYIRFVAKPDLSASGTDTAKLSFFAVKGGSNTVPTA